MPGFLTNFDERRTVRFTDDGDVTDNTDATWWAILRRYPRRGDFKAAQAVLLSPEMRFVDEVSDTRGKLDTGGYQDELVARSLIDWNLTGDDGAVIPLGNVDPVTGPDTVRYAAVRVLPEPVFEGILNAIEGAAARRPSKNGKEAPEAATFPGVGGGSAEPRAIRPARTR